jgi:NADH dehydrogenase
MTSAEPAAPVSRRALGGVLVVGGGFGGVSVARLLGKRGATIVSAQNSMLFTPLLPEVAGGVIETRNVMTPLAAVCRHAEVIAGHLTSLDLGARRAGVMTDGGLEITVGYDHVVLGVGAVPRLIPIPGLTEHAVGFTTVLDALYLRNQLLRLLAAAAVEPDPGYRSRDLTFVFVGGGYAGVEALSELRGLAQDALRYYPTLRGVPQRWVLVDAAPQILADIPSRLGQYATDVLRRWGVELRLSTRLAQVADGRVRLSDGTEIDAGLLVWTAGVQANPIIGRLGLPLDDRGRVRVAATLQVDDHPDAWALGDCAAVPNAATPGQLDPPTSQHALRQARRLAANLMAVQDGRPLQPYRFRSLGQVATLGRKQGIADLNGIRMSGLAGWLAARGVHLLQAPGATSRLRVLNDWVLSLLFPGNIVAFAGLLDPPTIGAAPARPLATPHRFPARDGQGAASGPGSGDG